MSETIKRSQVRWVRQVMRKIQLRKRENRDEWTSEQVQQDKWTCKIRETSSINDTSEIIKTSKTCKAITEHSNLVGS